MSCPFICANGSRCIRIRVKVSKKQTSSSRCPHEHIAHLLSNNKDGLKTLNEHHLDVSMENTWLERTSKFLLENRSINLTQENIARLEKKILDINVNNKWPKVYQVLLYYLCCILLLILKPNLESCVVCAGQLTAPARHSGTQHFS